MGIGTRGATPKYRMAEAPQRGTAWPTGSSTSTAYTEDMEEAQFFPREHWPPMTTHHIQRRHTGNHPGAKDGG
eukprot:5815467-Heterocapsa_arctica.AAC.1